MIYDTTPVEVLLKPMKGNSRKYRKYIIQLGKLDKRSPRVREKIVPFAVELYKEGDKIYRDIALFTYQAFLGQVCKVLEQLVGKDMEAIKKVCKYTPEAMADLLLKYEWICLEEKAALPAQCPVDGTGSDGNALYRKESSTRRNPC